MVTKIDFHVKVMVGWTISYVSLLLYYYKLYEILIGWWDLGYLKKCNIVQYYEVDMH